MTKTYRIKKILNNNVVSAVHGFQEVIVVGLSIGFQARVHDKVDPRKIEKIFELKREDFQKTSRLMAEIPESMVFDISRMLEKLSKKTRLELDAHAFITLIDHINFAIERYKKGQIIRNLMTHDLRILYPDAFQFGALLREAINASYLVDLPEDEIGFLTMHIVNGSNTDINNQSSLLTDLVLSCLNVIRDHYLIPLKLEHPITHRMMIHIKMLIQRVMSGKQVVLDTAMLESVAEQFDSALQCAEKVRRCIEEKLDLTVNPQELVYLTIHLNRLEQTL